jgi:hypothetical protein
MLPQGLTCEDSEFATKMSQISSIGRKRAGRRVNILLTVDGMIFLTQMLRTEVALKFRKEVLETVREVESQGFKDYQSLQKEVDDIRITIKELVAVNGKMMSLMVEKEQEICQLKNVLKLKQGASTLFGSAAGKNLAGVKKENAAKSILEKMH